MNCYHQEQKRQIPFFTLLYMQATFCKVNFFTRPAYKVWNDLTFTFITPFCTLIIFFSQHSNLYGTTRICLCIYLWIHFYTVVHFNTVLFYSVVSLQQDSISHNLACFCLFVKKVCFKLLLANFEHNIVWKLLKLSNHFALFIHF